MNYTEMFTWLKHFAVAAESRFLCATTGTPAEKRCGLFDDLGLWSALFVQCAYNTSMAHKFNSFR